MTSKRNISIRNIPEAIFQMLEKLSAEKERSLEGQARYMLKEAIENHFAPKEHALNKRCREVGERLRHMQTSVEPALLPSQLAEVIGDKSANFLENCFAGLEEPSFDQLKAIALHYGINYNWLAHGIGDIYFNEYKRLPEDRKLAATWLLDSDGLPWPDEDKVDEVYFVRNSSVEGELAIAKKSRGNRWAIFRTPTHVSSEIGNGGRAMLEALFGTLRLMWKIHLGRAKDFPQTDVYSYILKEEEFDALLDGMRSPATILKPQKHSHWWEDIWDKKMAEGKEHEYWEGYSQIKATILESIKFQQKEEVELKKLMAVSDHDH